MTPKRYIDRSRILAYQACPRARFLGYEHLGRGISREALSIPLATGTFIHRGLEQLLSGKGVEAAVTLARDEYLAAAEVAKGKVSGVLPDHATHTVAEQAALTEALVRVYAARGLPALQEEYAVVEVESEYEFELAPGLTFQARLDGLLRHRTTDELYVLSFKTDTGANLEAKIEEARLDMQGQTEPLAMYHGGWMECTSCNAVYKAPKEGDGFICPECHSWGGLPTQAFGVKMEWLVKGEWKEEPRGSGMRYQNSHLVRPYRRLGLAGTEFAWSYYWPCPGEKHSLLKANGSSWVCKGDQKTHGLGPSWERFNIWDVMPVAEWLDMLAAGEVQPGIGDPFAECLYLPPPIMRNAEDQAARVREIEGQELDITRRLGMLAEAQPAAFAATLDYAFPRTTPHPCLKSFGGKCQFYDICHAAAPTAALESALESGYVMRTPHHAAELAQIEGLEDGH